MSRYLDPKTDVVFKKIFGQHPHLLKSFLNAVLPLPEDGLIESLEYLSNEQVPAIPAFKYTVVDVRCTDQQGRIFIVEMQIQWTTGFMQRMLFNASKAYVNQLEKGEKFHLLRPIYGLGLLNTQFDADPEHWYHHYTMINVKKPEAQIKDLQLVFIELPKFKAKHFRQKKLQVLWLRFMAELNDKMKQLPSEWLDVSEIREAAALAEEAAYNTSELAAYDQYWDAISIEKTLVSEAHQEGLEKGEAIGIKKGKVLGIEEGIERGVEKGIEMIIQQLVKTHLSNEDIMEMTGLPLEKIQALRKK
jgi:predicted transposase/invertase (TIGR01784 family)